MAVLTYFLLLSILAAFNFKESNCLSVSYTHTLISIFIVIAWIRFISNLFQKSLTFFLLSHPTEVYKDHSKMQILIRVLIPGKV